jgi:NADPH-dependent curcumin reductase CurA
MSVETAYQALFTHAPLLPVAGTGAKGKRVFVTGASGAAGMVRGFIYPSYSCSFLTYLTKLEDGG